MIPNDLLTRLANALRVDPTQLLTAEPSSRNLEIPWAVGERVSAVVHSALGAGRTLARVGELPLDLKLPFPVKPGDRLSLILISRQPNVVFAVADPAQPASSFQVSRAGQWIGQLLSRIGTVTARQQPPEGAVASAIAKPLLTQPTMDILKLAQALKQGITESGLFYESHQAQWVQGERPRDALLREPQGKLPPLPQRPEVPLSHSVEEGAEPSRMSAPTMAAVSDSASAKAIGELIHPESVPQVQQQLQTLDARQVVWQGQPWPGLPMEWRIDDPPQRESDSGADMTWNTSLSLSLPQLGGVRARLALTGNQIRLQLNVDQGATRDRLTDGANGLIQGLADAGLVLNRFVVDVDAPP